MRRLLPPLIASLLTLAVSLSPPAGAERVERAGPPGAGSSKARCQAPDTLRLRRFEDGSAWLLCGGRVLVRVTVPG